MNKTKLKIVLGVMTIFLLGLVIGSLGSGIYLKRRVEQFTKRAPKERKSLMMAQLSRELDLNEAQKPQVRKIIDASESEIRQFIQQSRIAFDALIERRNVELKAILTDKQYRRLQVMEKRMRKRWGPPPPPDDNSERSRPPRQDGPRRRPPEQEEL